MRIVIGVDGSPCADTALALVRSLPWPPGCELRLVSALDIMHLVGPWATFGSVDVAEMAEGIGSEARAMLTERAERFSTTGVELAVAAVEGRPSTVIVEAAEEAEADLIVVGSRGQGALRTMLLGSVSTEVVDHARRPVLVARRAAVTRILLAHDGSRHARAAEDLLVRFSPLAGIPIEVLSVLRAQGPWTDEVAPVAQGRAAVATRASLQETLRHHEDIATAASERLAAAGHEVRAEVRAGDPARILVDEAEARGVDLIAMGTHGRTGLERLRLGSVARKVLTHAHCSVLIVRPEARGPE